MPIEELTILPATLGKAYDIAIGSREVKGRSASTSRPTGT